MRHCGRGSGCSQHYLNYDAKVYNSSLPKITPMPLLLLLLLMMMMIVKVMGGAAVTWHAMHTLRRRRWSRSKAADTDTTSAAARHATPGCAVRSCRSGRTVKGGASGQYPVPIPRRLVLPLRNPHHCIAGGRFLLRLRLLLLPRFHLSLSLSLSLRLSLCPFLCMVVDYIDVLQVI